VLVACGLCTPFHEIATAPDEAVALAALRIRSEPGAAALTVHPEAAPSPVGCETNVEAALEKLVGVMQPPVRSVQNFISTDFTAVVVGSAAVANVYETPVASPTEVDITMDRPVIGAASTLAIFIIGKILIAIISIIVLIIPDFEWLAFIYFVILSL
jgi:hypothetical protein